MEIVKSFVAAVDHSLITLEDLDVLLGEPIDSILDVDISEATSVSVPKKEASRLPNFVAKVPVMSNVENVHAHIDRLNVAGQESETKSVRSTLGDAL